MSWKFPSPLQQSTAALPTATRKHAGRLGRRKSVVSRRNPESKQRK